MNTQKVPGGRFNRFNVVLGIAFAIGAVIAIWFGSVTNWYGLAASRFEQNVQYEFVYTKMARAVFGDVELETREFQIDQETIFTVLAVGPRGEQAVIEDMTLPPNTFLYTERLVPQVVLGSRLFQSEYRYVETRYHVAHEEPQGLVPVVPERR